MIIYADYCYLCAILSMLTNVKFPVRRRKNLNALLLKAASNNFNDGVKNKSVLLEVLMMAHIL